MKHTLNFTNNNIHTYSYKKDKKIHKKIDENIEISNIAHGYSFLIQAKECEYDYTYSALRCKYFFDDCILTTSFEDKNPYPTRDPEDKEKGWEIYLDEWLIRYISHPDFLKANNISKVNENIHIKDFKGKYELIKYSYFIEDSANIDHPYYNIAIIRDINEFTNFYLFVMKSKSDKSEVFNDIINSFKEIEKSGKAANIKETYELNINPNWNEMTKKYFNKLCEQQHVDWGIFIASLTSEKDSAFDYINSIYEKEGDKLDKLMNHNMELLPTYMHISWHGHLHYFPTTMANKLAQGDGFNGKKVLHFTFQYTADNNTSLFGYSPSYDILRGKYDEYFRQLAKDIKAYRYPVLFRLNNEMNTDWTTYSGIASLLDPDIFILTWKRLYDIFTEEGVDNCIWIFNPIHITTPFCNWGEYLNYYPANMVNVLGLTSYERGNFNKLTSFKSLYSALYKKNSPYFNNFPHIISEFGCGAGGKVITNYEENRMDYVKEGRNLYKQKYWVKKMFEQLKQRHNYCKNIKAAIWFSANDYGFKDDKWHVMNYFKLDDNVMPTILEFNKGFNDKND